MENPLFKETQYFSHSPMQVGFLLLVAVVLIYRYGSQVRNFFAQPGINKALSVFAIIIFAVVVVILCTMKLETVYYPHHIDHRFSSIYATGFDAVSLDSVTKAEVLKYDPNDYGGWGVKGNENTRVFNTSGDKGILLIFKSGQRLLLGTHQPDSLRAKLKGYYPLAN